jgi:hypothetical protein
MLRLGYCRYTVGVQPVVGAALAMSTVIYSCQVSGPSRPSYVVAVLAVVMQLVLRRDI